MSYRVGVVVGGREPSGTVSEILAWAQGNPAVDLIGIVVPRTSDATTANCTPLARTLLGVLAAAERKLLRQAPRRNVGSQTAIWPEALVLSGAAAEDCEKLRALDLDVVVDLASDGNDGGLASVARDGLVCVQSGRCTGGLPGFVEVLEGSSTSSFVVVRFDHARSEILMRGSITTQLFWRENSAALDDRSAVYLVRAIDALARGDLTGNPERDRRKACPPVTTKDVLNYVSRSCQRALQKGWRHAIGREWNWRVGYCFAPWQSADLASGRILPNLADTFVADPFVVEFAGKRYVFVEEFPYATRKGVISVFELGEAGARRIGVALEEPFHLSFPFVFENNGCFYMVPEGQGGGELVLYECQDFPLRWIRKKVLLSKVCADTLIFPHGALWWMLTTIKGSGSAENSAELHAFFANDPLGEWQPHGRNPIIIDASRGRNGGILEDDEGRIYRVAQRAGFRTYGDGFAIYRIDELTPESYCETAVREVSPDFFPKLSGTHHMHSKAGVTVYDFSRDERP